MCLELGVIPLREIIRKRRLGFLYYILGQRHDSMMYKVLESQMKNRTPKDWVTMVLQDFKLLELDMNIEDIKKIKKFECMNMIKRKIEHKALRDLNRVKESHSKVRELKHTLLKMQKYLMPNDENLSKEDAQLIFKLRSRVTETKTNMKGKYDSHECSACGEENENQEHVIKCNVLLQMNSEYGMKFRDYQHILNGNVAQQLEISRFSKSKKRKSEDEK